MVKFNQTIVVLVTCILSSCQFNTAHTSSKQTSYLQLELLFMQSFDEPISRVDISDDGENLLAGSSVEKIRYWSTEKLNTPTEASFDSDLIAFNFIGKDNSIFFANGLGTTRILADGLSKTITEYNFPQGQSTRYSSASNDTELIAYGEYLYNRTQNKLLPSSVGHAVQSSLQIGQQKNVLTSGYHDRYVALRDINGNIITDWRVDGKVSTAAMSDDSKYVIASTQNGNCYVWEPPNKKASHRCDSWREHVFAIHISKTNNVFVLIRQKSISAYHLVPFKKLFTKHIDGAIRSSAISNNNWLAIGLDSGDVQLWDVLQGKLLANVQPSKVNISSIDVNQDAKLLMVGSDDGIVALYRIRN